MEKITVTIQMNKAMYEKIRKAAYDKNVSNSEIIRQCCDFYFNAVQAKTNPALEVKGE